MLRLFGLVGGATSILFLFVIVVVAILLSTIGLQGIAQMVGFGPSGRGGGMFDGSSAPVPSGLDWGTYLWLAVILLFVSPWLFRAYGRTLGLPGRILLGVWNGAVRLFILSPIPRAIDRITPSSVDGWLAKRTLESSSLLLQGDRRAHAEAMWPPARFPTLYQDIPADVRRSIVWDGRLIGGHPVPWLAWRHVTASVVSGLARTSGRIGTRAAAIVALLCVVAVIVRLVAGGYHSSISYPSWSEGIAYGPRAGWYLYAAVDLVLRSLSGIGLALAGAACLAPAFIYFAFWNGLHSWWSGATDALATPTRDSLVIYKSRADIRTAEYAAYCRQVKRAIQLQDDEQQPVIPVGKAMGVLRARGDMEAPERGQMVCLDGDSIRQHTLILGGTGAGKTRLAVRPLFGRIMSADWGVRDGQAHRIGAYVTDGKGTLWRDLQGSPALVGRDDVVIIGTGEGQCAIDLLKGMSPLEVATTLKAVSGQVMGAPSDEFWPESASLLMLHCATVAFVLDMDDETVATEEWENHRPWSLLGLGRLATNTLATEAAVQRVYALSAQHPHEEQSAIRVALDDPSLLASLDWLRGTWATMPNETKGSIIANVNIILGKLGGAGELRDRFCTGQFADAVEISHALNGGVLMIAVGETEWGMVGKVISVWLKTRLYIEARKKLQNDLAGCRRTSCALFADEWQMLATTGPDSDASFWNVARETGVFLVAATQSLAALKQVLGEDATANLINLLRTKIVLKTEEISTLDYCVKLAGETMRGVVLDEDFFETQGQREIERPDVAPPPFLSSEVRLARVLPTIPSMSTVPSRDVLGVDTRFLSRASPFSAQPGDGNAALSSQQASYWRQEDKEKEARGNGLQWRPKVSIDELLLGSGMAFAIVQRAGCDRSDIIDLD